MLNPALLKSAALVSALAAELKAASQLSHPNLVKVIAQHGFPVHERALRACINLLRKNGQLVKVSWEEAYTYIASASPIGTFSPTCSITRSFRS